MKRETIGATVLAILATAAIGLCGSASAAEQTLRINLSACVNQVISIGQPVGRARGNAETELSALKFDLLDPAAGNNMWLGTAGGRMDISLSVAGVTAVYALMNTLYGQPDVANATVIFQGAQGTQKSFKMIGNKNIRDFNNWIFTNEIDGRRTQEWWTNNLNPTPLDHEAVRCA
jgi:hypothetical protein